MKISNMYKDKLRIYSDQIKGINYQHKIIRDNRDQIRNLSTKNPFNKF